MVFTEFRRDRYAGVHHLAKSPMVNMVDPSQAAERPGPAKETGAACQRVPKV
ncbi:MAG TPA: hypothetical protein VGD71_28525 [Kribbella sp.]